jgi:gliding motility-associated-like protein
VFDQGNSDGLNPWDTLDLDYNPRISCTNVDIGAFEVNIAKTEITVQPVLSGKIDESQPMLLQVTAVGDALKYQWQKNEIDIPGQTSNTFSIPNVSVADVGFYRVIVFGMCCNDTSNVVHLDVNLPISSDTLAILTNHDNGCVLGDGRIQIDVVSGMPPFTYTLTGPASFSHTRTTGELMAVIENLQPGTYTAKVTDSTGAEQSGTITIEPVVKLHITYSTDEPRNADCTGGNIRITPSGGVPDYFFTWISFLEGDNFSTSKDLLNVQAGTYSLLLSDSRGCEERFEIALPCRSKRVMSTLFISPNGDGFNDFLSIKHIEMYPKNTVTIISSYGEEIISIENYNNFIPERRWDGRNRRGQALPDGTYYYVVVADGVPSPMAGSILMKLSSRR